MEESNKTTEEITKPDYNADFKREEEFISRVEKWIEDVQQNDDYGYINIQFTNSVYASHSFEWEHYGYSRKDHQYIEQVWDLNFDNACLVTYTIRQYSEAEGPSSDLSDFLGDMLNKRDYYCLGTTSDDERGTHLTFWYLKEFGEAEHNPDFDPDEEDWEPYNRWDDPYDDEEY